VLDGYTNHRWNGITALHFARLCRAVIGGAEIPPVLHLVPADSVTKADLIELIAADFGRDDLTLRRVPGPEPRDLRLATQHPEELRRLWAEAGYQEAPTVEAMLHELAGFAAAPA
jgi:dTDP-4-dehydrorhamnose reductase